MLDSCWRACGHKTSWLIREEQQRFLSSTPPHLSLLEHLDICHWKSQDTTFQPQDAMTNLGLANMNGEKRLSGNSRQWGLPALFCLPLRFKGTQLRYIIIGRTGSQFVSQSGRRHVLLKFQSWTPNLQVSNLGSALILHCYGWIALLGS